MNNQKTAAGQIQLIKQRSAIKIFEYINTHSTPALVLDEPNYREKNYKSKIITSVASSEAAIDLINAINDMAEVSSSEIASLIHQKKPAIRYRSSVICLDEPVVRLSVRNAETVLRLPICEVIPYLHTSVARLDINDSDTLEMAATINFINKLYNSPIDLKSSEIVRLSRSSGRSYRVQAFSAGASIQQNIGDLCIMVYEYPDSVKVVPAGKRKTRSDALQYDPLVTSSSWTLSRYIINE